MFRTELPDNQGMLFSIYPPRTANFWMRNVFINLDMVFLRDGGKYGRFFLIYLLVKLKLCPTYEPDTPVDGVIELRGPRTMELGLRVGDRINIQPIFPSKNTF